jgi:hypothetical protein
MKIIKKSEERVKILIGKNKQGECNLERPVKTILVYDSSVQEVFDKVIKSIECENENK